LAEARGLIQRDGLSTPVPQNSVDVAQVWAPSAGEERHEAEFFGSGRRGWPRGSGFDHGGARRAADGNAVAGLRCAVAGAKNEPLSANGLPTGGSPG